MTTPEKLIPVQTRLEESVNAELQELAREGRRSIAAELYLAVKAWIAYNQKEKR